MVTHTLPFDVGRQHFTILFYQLLFTFTSFSFGFWKAFVPIILAQAYVLIGVRHWIYGDDINLQLALEFVVGSLWLSVNCYGIHLLMSIFGYFFVESEVAHMDDAKLLNNMKEAILIVDDVDGNVLFRNNTAKQLNTMLTSEESMSLFSKENLFDKNQPLFALIDRSMFNTIANLDHAKIVGGVLAQNDYLSMQDIIRGQLANN